MSRFHRSFALVAAVAASAAAGAWWIDALMNRSRPAVVDSPTDEAADFHRKATIVDLNASSLVWERDLSERSRRGHLDLPRLREGGVDVQVFGLITRVPLPVRDRGTDSRGPDALSIYGLLRGWPRRAVFDPPERAYRQIEQVERWAADPENGLRIVRSRADLDDAIVDPRSIGVLFALEGAHALADLDGSLQVLADRGVRIVGLVHGFDNEYAGSAHGRLRGGLTEAGRRLVEEAARRGIVVDLAHASSRTIDDVLDLDSSPVLVSDVGVRGHCDLPGNLSDGQAHRIAELDGLIAIGVGPDATCGKTLADVALAVRYVVDLVGPDHVALGSGFDGGFAIDFDASSLPSLTSALLDVGLDPETVTAVMGRNAVGLLRSVLPAEPASPSQPTPTIPTSAEPTPTLPPPPEPTPNVPPPPEPTPPLPTPPEPTPNVPPPPEPTPTLPTPAESTPTVPDIPAEPASALTERLESEGMAEEDPPP